MGDSVNTLFNTFNESMPPKALDAEGNLSKNWCAWRSQFLIFLKEQDQTESRKNKWGTYLLMFIGPVGQQAYKEFIFDKESDKENIEILLRKFDLHFIFGSRTRQRNESIDEYVHSLMEIARSSNHSNFQDIVKEKVMEDIKSIKYSEKAQAYLNTLGPSLDQSLKPLVLSKIMTIWKKCERLTIEKSKEQAEGQKTNSSTKKEEPSECIACGSKHGRNKCPAHGKQCSNCNRFNHFTEKCTVKFVRDCPKCGSDHVQSLCIAFGKICSKCGKKNHLSEKCQALHITNCSRCGTDHITTACPAKGKLCPRCKKPNHFQDKCFTKLEDD